MKIKKGDKVMMMVGKDRNKTGIVLRAFPKEEKIMVEGLHIVKKHRRPQKAGQKGEIVHIPRPFPAARAQLVCPHCGKPTRVGYRFEDIDDGKRIKVRICKKCKASIK